MTAPTLAERITSARAALVATKDAITAITAKDTMDASEVVQLDELSQTSLRQGEELAVLERAEKALAVGSVPITGEHARAAQPPAQVQAQLPAARRPTAPALNVRGHINSRGLDLIVRSALIAFESRATHETHDAVIARRYPGNLEVAEVTRLLAGGGIVSKAATNPAMMGVATWAQELTREGYGAFLEALTGESVVPQLPMQTYSFDGYAKLHIPGRANAAPGDPNLAAAFRAEGAPIRVGKGALQTKILTPKSMAIIGTFTKELLMRSTPDIETEIRTWMLQDTAVVLDGVFLDNGAGTTVRPAGIQNGIAAGDTAASTGATGAAMLADLTGRLKALAGHNMGRRPVFVMNSANAWALKLATTPTGEPQFPDAMTRNEIAGVPIIASTNVPVNIVFLIDAAEIAFAGGAPTFEGTEEATLHEDDGVPNTGGVTGASVLPIVDGTGTVAKPVRSLFQTHSAAVKALWDIDWVVYRPGCVQTITGVAW
jgi:hypothetical protein